MGPGLNKMFKPGYEACILVYGNMGDLLTGRFLNQLEYNGLSNVYSLNNSISVDLISWWPVSTSLSILATTFLKVLNGTWVVDCLWHQLQLIDLVKLQSVCSQPQEVEPKLTLSSYQYQSHL